MSATAVSAFMITSVVLFVALDVYLAVDRDEDGKPIDGNTYSEIIRDTGNRRPWFRVLFLVSVGVLLGHWFW